jgi:5-methylcytosine-specific restriction protein B
VFRRICDRAKADPENRYAIAIDEINRGNISKIFGELITLIEPDKRAVYGRSGSLVDGMEAVLPYSGKPFGVPKNLDVYGTMNTADRSIALLDTALRRRFDFEELTPDVTVIKGEGGDGYIPDGEGGLINLRELLQAMNSRIRFLLNRDQMIGHSYFCRVRSFSTVKRIMLNKIVPLLQEYFYEDWHRIQLVLRDVGPEGKPIRPQIIRHTKAAALNVLGVDSGDYEEVVEYSAARPEDIGPEAFRKIYEV